MPALRGELLALRKAPILKLKALPTLIIRLRTLALKVKLVVIFIKVRAKAKVKGK